MIGVLADPSDHDVVREFFELFKTPWQFWRRGHRYDVVLCAGDARFDELAKVVILYAGRKVPLDDEKQIPIRCQRGHARNFLYQGNRIPIYGDIVTFPETKSGLLADEASNESGGYIERSTGRLLARVGYDLIGEVRTLLSLGQPAANAMIPALEWHIGLLRDLITGSGVPLVEIPPIPDGYQFIACLTHDVDHPSILPHKWDHTTAGFLYRALLRSVRDAMRARISIKDLFTNWAAALKLPFIHLGIAKDFWRDFDDRYLELERDLRSTFFVIPFGNRSGKNSHGSASMLRAAQYGAEDIADKIRRLLAAGCEIGLHGIDAWLDSSSAREEIERITRLTGVSEIGVRMHWLYYDKQSPATLEEAGATYDSTIGYNETVGYRAGTTQVYKPIEANWLLELPLHVMDTALFFPGYLGLSRAQARTVLDRLMDNAIQFGGCLTINWHDRSTAPERLWGACYRDLLEELKRRGAWCSTAGRVTAWFRKRRSAVFETDCNQPGSTHCNLMAVSDDDLPGLQLRTHDTPK